jgi:transposase InsO family protein
MIERFFEALKYERLYRHDIRDGIQLADHTADFKTIYNSIRPHEAIAMARPLERYRQTPTTNIPDPESVSDP